MKRSRHRAQDYNCHPLAKRAAPLDDLASSEVLELLPTVLVIESDPVLRNLLREILSRNTYIVLDAVNIGEAAALLLALPNQPVHLLIADGAPENLLRLKDSVLTLRPSCKTLLTIRGDAAGAANLQAFDNSGILCEPFTEARLLNEIAALLQPRTQ